jgi:hypothetical protein
VLNTLPGINIQFDFGRIVLFGSDLFSHDPVTNTCSPRYTVSDNGQFIVPQLFPDMSVKSCSFRMSEMTYEHKEYFFVLFFVVGTFVS